MCPVIRGTTSARAHRIILAVEGGIVEEVAVGYLVVRRFAVDENAIEEGAVLSLVVRDGRGFSVVETEVIVTPERRRVCNANATRREEEDTRAAKYRRAQVGIVGHPVV